MANENQPLLEGEHYSTDRELSQRLKISRRTLQDYRNNSILPYRQLEGKILYRESDIEQVLQKIAHLLCHTDKESFAGMLSMWHEKWGEWLKHRTLDRKTGKKSYTHQRVRSAYFSMKRHMKWLWTWYDYPDTPMPNTNNILEAINTDLKTKLRVHNGMSKRYRKLFIDEYFRLKYK